jgi:hypothetical protein
MRVCVIDGRGGGVGARLVGQLRAAIGDPHRIVALGTNQAATRAMKEAGAHHADTGESAISRTVLGMDVIVASLNLVLPDSMLGEVTPEIARAILGAPGRKVFLPLNQRGVEVAGTEGRTLEALIDSAVRRVQTALRPETAA